jgi:hypothetical protein
MANTVSLLGDALRLVESDPGRANSELGEDYWDCPHCSGRFDHDDDCAWLSMPKIVAVLKAAERVAEALKEDEAHYAPRYLTHGAAEALVAALQDDS